MLTLFSSRSFSCFGHHMPAMSLYITSVKRTFREVLQLMKTCFIVRIIDFMHFSKRIIWFKQFSCLYEYLVVQTYVWCQRTCMAPVCCVSGASPFGNITKSFVRFWLGHEKSFPFAIHYSFCLLFLIAPLYEVSFRRFKLSSLHVFWRLTVESAGKCCSFNYLNNY